MVAFGLLWAPLLFARSIIEDSAADELPAPCPAAMVSIDGKYCIDAFEARLTLANGETHPFYVPPGEQAYCAVSQRGVYPQAHISRQHAEAACQTAGKRLCTSGEWEKACRGPEPTPYPYGIKRRAGYCNDRGVAPLAVLFGYDRVEYGAQTMNDRRLDRVPGSLARTGVFGRCVNSYGVHDMVGNLHEWIDDPSGVMRGGFYLDATTLGEGCSYRTVGHDPSYRDYSTGFRCCADTHR